jgi:hypothetical protein
MGVVMEKSFRRIPEVKPEATKTLNEVVASGDESKYFTSWAATIKKAVLQNERVNEYESSCLPSDEAYVAMDKLMVSSTVGLFSAHWIRKVNTYPEFFPEDKMDKQPYLYPIVTGFMIGYPVDLETLARDFTKKAVPFLTQSGSNHVLYYEIWINPNYPFMKKELSQKFRKCAIDEAAKTKLNAVTIKTKITTQEKRTLHYNEGFRIEL